MARKIKETPILTGKDAQRFVDAVKANELKKVSPEEYKKTMDSYRRFKVVKPTNVD